MIRETIALLATILFTTLCWSATEKEKATARLHDAADVLHSLVSAPENRHWRRLVSTNRAKGN